MTTKYNPGMVAKVLRYDRDEYETAIFDNYGRWSLPHGAFGRGDIEDVKPVVVLDLDDPRETVRELDYARRMVPSGPLLRLTDLANQIGHQVAPPKPDEPGLWGVVEANYPDIPRRRWVHHEENRWVSDGGTIARWQELSDIELVREGVA